MSDSKIRKWFNKNKGKILAVVAVVGTGALATAIYCVCRQSGQSAPLPAYPTPDSNQIPCTITPLPPCNSIMSVSDKAPHDVSSHLRTLPEGWKASPDKIATAAAHGYDLLPGQTWVDSYRTGT